MSINGYRVSHRNRWLLLKNKILTIHEFLLLEYYIDVSDWDDRHKKYGVFEAYLEEISEEFGRKKDAVRKWHNGLYSKKFIVAYDLKRKLFQLKSPQRYNTKNAEVFHKEEDNEKALETLLLNITFSTEEIEKTQQEVVNLALKNEDVGLM
ncbi:hypothetical protein A3A75_05580 [Candidatus Woesebacteria bacterium RIFCSPLOWO2_01_FULL_39_10]|uniref:Uncharacterized protein n=1 Tax=Candidatus Woesebacteria bacterium RIFCSPLOWO2_01_FULL_39_10 TaxID=1802516 RepID=A0A1F8B5B7_9BACT|nr:MAG: hypothetical protein A3A75_05580 [Candidatus Woesebacteria bacterium RIFCSPLOWO2_01_FULL_39_10]